jgi:hypothetical protein
MNESKRVFLREAVAGGVAWLTPVVTTVCLAADTSGPKHHAWHSFAAASAVEHITSAVRS